MDIENLRKTIAADGSVSFTCLLDGAVAYVPANAGNRHFDIITAAIAAGDVEIIETIDLANPPPPTKDALVAHAADIRWRKEIGGINVAGVPVATDDRSKQMIIGARIAADADPNWTTQWVGGDGSIYPIDATAIVAISNAVQAHVNACFATFASVKSDIDASTITTTAEIDAAFAA